MLPAFGEDALVRVPLGMALVRAWESSLGRMALHPAVALTSIRMDRTYR